MKNRDDKVRRIARRVVADYGDTQAYFNVFEFFELRGADNLDVKTAESVLSNAVHSNRRMFDKLVRATLKRRARELSEVHGLQLK